MLILLDRDGVLNQDRADYVKSPAEWVPIPGIGPAIAALNARGWKVVICTNQACIGKGIIDEAMLDRIHDAMRAHIAVDGARIDDILFAPDPPWAQTERRKPGPGMMREAMAKYRERPDNTVFIGDTDTDMLAASRAGCRRILVRSGKGAATLAKGLPPEAAPVAVFADLAEAVQRLLADGAEAAPL
ncbi:HAD-IIIA family hydrolase [Ferrovibrio sp.]|uniref:D-glycero-alpha-D-manno-heptose-1,7-bisphosphate 7-phosphatase n=1 Tax=Ferrovibrio sp. TaxID=1917215 RepID=UPI0025BE9328|nr:HAD-IIIA family hydrolase [Ferrovibrio sp.]MBX3456049.1 HAD-IIIA family hydrolase [Ferrovibrio sp.]